MEGKYELHITLSYEAPIPPNWKQTGWIKADADHGGQDRFYLTSYAPSEVAAHVKIGQAMNWLEDQGYNPIRAKIEHIIYDERF